MKSAESVIAQHSATLEAHRRDIERVDREMRSIWTYFDGLRGDIVDLRDEISKLRVILVQRPGVTPGTTLSVSSLVAIVAVLLTLVLT